MKKFLILICALILTMGLVSCGMNKKEVKIGVSMGVGEALRWPKEMAYMEARAKELGIKIETRLNKVGDAKTQEEDCREMIDSGIKVLILTPRDVKNVKEILDYANEKGVKVVNYARVALNKPIELFVGYDVEKIGQSMGQYLAEMVDKGDYILLRGDAGDGNAQLLYDGAMRYISKIEGDINILLDSEVKGWSAQEAKKMVIEAIKANGNKVDAILAPNDTLASACVEAVDELGLTNEVIITGMDAELTAVQNIAKGKQSCTFYMDLKEMSEIAVDGAYNIALGKDMAANTEYNNGWDGGVMAHLITGRLITKENLDKIVIDAGIYTKEQVYGK